MTEVALKHGLFSWTDLTTLDTDAAKAFYGALFGWQHNDLPAGDGMTYTIFTHSGKDVAGLSVQPPEQRAQGAPPTWNSYILVDDVDDVATRAEGLGALLVMEPFDVMDSGRMAVIQDPTGAVVSFWQAGTFSGAGHFNEPVSLTWNELYTRSAPEAKAFYSELLGWRITEEDMPAPGTYSMISVGERQNGGILSITAEMGELPPHWMVYFSVADVSDTADRAAELGGRIAVPPTDIGVGRFAVLADDQGATFTVFKSNPA